VSTILLDATPRTSRLGIAIAAAILTVLPGFIAMALLGSLGRYSPSLPGFWDYPSGTIGDALLLPTVVAGLVVAINQLPHGDVEQERRVAVAAVIVGSIGGAAVPLTWLLGPDTQPFWMLPRPHHYVLAGWWHAVYLSCTTATIAALALVCFRRLHAARRSLRRDSTALTFAVGAGVGMLVLIGRDSVNGGFTASSAVTMGSLVLVLLAVVGGLWWAVGGEIMRAQRPSAFLIVTFAAGLVAIIVRWLPHKPLLVGITAVMSLVAALAATSSFSRNENTEPYRFPAAIAMTALLTGGLVRSADAVARHEPWPMGWIVGGTLAAMAVLWLVGPRDEPRRRVLGYGLFLGYCLFLCYLAEHLEVRHASASFAAAAVVVAGTTFDALVLAFVRTRFHDLGASDMPDIEADYLTEADHEADPTAYLSPPVVARARGSSPDEVTADVSLLGLAVAMGLLTLLAVAAGPVGLNRRTVSPPSSDYALLGAVVVLPALLGACAVTLGRWRTRTPEPPIDPKLAQLHLPAWFWIFPLIAAALWTACVVSMISGSPHEPLVAALGTALVVSLYTNALLADTTRLQTLTATLAQRVVAAAAGLSIGTATFWLLGFAVAYNGRPVSPRWFALLAFGVFVGNTLVYACAGYSLAAGLPRREYRQQRQLARDTIIGYLGLDAACFGVVVGAGLSIPVYVALRYAQLHPSQLNGLASLLFLPGFAWTVWWGLNNWKVLDDMQEPARRDHGISRVLLRRTEGSWAAADALDARRKTILHYHLRFQIGGVGALMALGIGTIVTSLLR
jgi:hypothetical protein